MDSRTTCVCICAAHPQGCDDGWWTSGNSPVTSCTGPVDDVRITMPTRLGSSSSLAPSSLLPRTFRVSQHIHPCFLLSFVAPQIPHSVLGPSFPLVVRRPSLYFICPPPYAMPLLSTCPPRLCLLLRRRAAISCSPDGYTSASGVAPCTCAGGYLGTVTYSGGQPTGCTGPSGMYLATDVFFVVVLPHSMATTLTTPDSLNCPLGVCSNAPRRSDLGGARVEPVHCNFC